MHITNLMTDVCNDMYNEVKDQISPKTLERLEKYIKQEYERKGRQVDGSQMKRLLSKANI